MSDKSDTTEAKGGQDQKGKFVPGNRCHRKFHPLPDARNIREALQRAIPNRNVIKMFKALMVKAQRGDVQAATLLAKYMLPDPSKINDSKTDPIKVLVVRE